MVVVVVEEAVIVQIAAVLVAVLVVDLLLREWHRRQRRRRQGETADSKRHHVTPATPTVTSEHLSITQFSLLVHLTSSSHKPVSHIWPCCFITIITDHLHQFFLLF